MVKALDGRNQSVQGVLVVDETEVPKLRVYTDRQVVRKKKVRTSQDMMYALQNADHYQSMASAHQHNFGQELGGKYHAKLKTVKSYTQADLDEIAQVALKKARKASSAQNASGLARLECAAIADDDDDEPCATDGEGDDGELSEDPDASEKGDLATDFGVATDEAEDAKSLCGSVVAAVSKAAGAAASSGDVERSSRQTPAFKRSASGVAGLGKEPPEATPTKRAVPNRRCAPQLSPVAQSASSACSATVSAAAVVDEASVDLAAGLDDEAEGRTKKPQYWRRSITMDKVFAKDKMLHRQLRFARACALRTRGTTEDRMGGATWEQFFLPRLQTDFRPANGEGRACVRCCRRPFFMWASARLCARDRVYLRDQACC